MKEITNKPVPRQYEERFEELTRGEEVLFIVVGDLDLKGKYADSMLVFTKNGLIAFDRSFDGGVCSIAPIMKWSRRMSSGSTATRCFESDFQTERESRSCASLMPPPRLRTQVRCS